ncbi:hypothetical protein HK104_002616 [Borealophlyctis nickersoniae]|nr:hypothetical protein HK104_002616 [Borealophlyctis nickersoniae]
MSKEQETIEILDKLEKDVPVLNAHIQSVLKEIPWEDRRWTPQKEAKKIEVQRERERRIRAKEERKKAVVRGLYPKVEVTSTGKIVEETKESVTKGRAAAKPTGARRALAANSAPGVESTAGVKSAVGVESPAGGKTAVVPAPRLVMLFVMDL